MGVWLKPTFHATPLPLCHETSVCTLEVSGVIRGSLPRPWGEGGRRPGEGQPTGIAPKMSKLEPPVLDSRGTLLFSISLSSLCSWCLGGDL
jgi:hypothetical protein